MKAGLRVLGSRFRRMRECGPVRRVGAEVGSTRDVIGGLGQCKCRADVRGVMHCIGSVTKIHLVYSFASSVCQLTRVVKGRDSLGILSVGSCVGGPGRDKCGDCRVLISIPVFLSSDIISAGIRVRVEAVTVSF